MSRQRGTALLEIIVVGFAVMLMVLPVVSTVARLTEANATVHATARDAAVWIARHGGDPPEVEGVGVSVFGSEHSIEVVATQEVVLVGLGGATISRTVRSVVEVPVSRYRSSP
ncbi:MAG: hypothetical protein DRJ28_02590 [Actinobacteria bacterium]|nr:MAG: hypothetical protein DRJ28_02590 [Actinomycetota bacterium]